MQHKVNIDKEYNFIEALRDDHYASFGGVRNSRGRGLRMADDLFCCMQKHHGGKYMRVNFKRSAQTDVNMKKKQRRTLQSTLNTIGILMFIGILIRWWTVPFAVSKDLRIYYNQNFQMTLNECKEFLAFILCAAGVYVTLVNVYFLGKTGRKLVYTVLVLLAVFNLYMMLTLLIIAAH
ncbi:hypothetical protein [Priestia aryabhattai]|uniref:hypothetical protein n=3 Tax=Priestia TaxID=2800373 RepID=UPI001ADC7516|nr:hypothetical protein [Priestia aryabhattai]QTL47807.1 hypothetical protein J5Z55_17145 [Priestia aryabhattai]